MNKIIGFCLLTLLLSQCECDDDIGKETLPPATQTGANTFGCLVNGKVWLPRGNNGTANLDISYDPNFAYGLFSLYAYRYQTEADDSQQYIVFYSDSLKSAGTYNLNISNRQEALFSDDLTNCAFLQGEQHYKEGTLVITKFDLTEMIISGTFEFVLAKTDCDTIRVTKGRFDMRI